MNREAQTRKSTNREAAGREDVIIIPLYNEERSVAGVLRRTRRMTGAPILVVDDGSEDGSVRILAGLQEEIPLLCAIRHAGNEGYGSALIDGFDYVARHGFRYAVTMDCDEQHEPGDIPRLLREIRKKGVDILSGSRYALGAEAGEAPAPAERRAINEIITAEINAITGYGLTDAFCGFKAYRLDRLQELRLSETGYGFPLQFWLQAWARGLTVAETPVARIYKANFERRFGGGLDDGSTRLAHYRDVVKRELESIRDESGQRRDQAGI